MVNHAKLIMKRIFKLFIIYAFILTFAILLNNEKNVSAGSLSVKGIWLSCFEFNEEGLYNVSQKEYTSNINKIMKKVKKTGLNNIYFHVRAYDDAIYPSKVVKWSKYISKNGNALSYDPLKIAISRAHAYKIKFHAWLNPYRLTQSKILNPAKKATNDRIVNQVKEIVKNYDVDGIHFDDYFYLNNSKYKNVSKAKRKENVNTMVKAVYKAVKEIDKSVLFGISPAGSIKYCDEIGADVKTWMSQKGYVDYIIPQIYWSDKYILYGKKTKMFTNTLKEWRKYNILDLPLYVGLAAYKAGEYNALDKGWKNKSTNLYKQLKKIKAGNSEGFVLFDYSCLDNQIKRKEINNLISYYAKFSLNKKKLKLKKKKTYKLKIKGITPKIIKKRIRFKSSNNKIATVTKSGKIKARKKGKVKIYAYYGQKKKKCLLIVK